MGSYLYEIGVYETGMGLRSAGHISTRFYSAMFLKAPKSLYRKLYTLIKLAWIFSKLA
mgnify:CR=1 FL=1